MTIPTSILPEGSYNLGYGGAGSSVSAPSPSFDAGSLGVPEFGFNAAGGATGGSGGILGNLFGGTGGGGFDSLGGFGGIAGGAGDALGAITGIIGAINAGKEAKLAREAFDFQKDAYNQNTALQAQTINNRLEDRQIAREAYGGKERTDNRYGTLSEYMDKNAVQTKTL